MSLPSPSDILSAIRSSCEAVALPLNEQAIDDFILSVDPSEWSKLSQSHGVRLPLKFDSPRQELNLLATLGLLNFLSGYRRALHRLTTRGAYSTILSLVLSAYLSSGDDDSSILSGKGMKSCTVASIASLAQITTHSESDHPTLGPAVKVGTKDAEAFEILELVVGVLNETGQILEDLEMKDFGEWFEGELCRTKGDSGAMIHSMATTFPAFKDVHLVNGEPIYLFKKALWTLNAVSTRFSREEEGGLKFPVPGGNENFPIFADNVLPSMLIHYKILPHPSSLDSTPSPTILRASSVYACQQIAKRAHELVGNSREWVKDWNEVELDGYLWSLAKEGTRRNEIERVVEEKGTVYY